ncbi:putative harbinger transposase-derived nuclease domain-containing protein [Helianthus annuus]|nr:putative harbinger transposase-derived nuclease domain-containing protein [Helianthus annuus]
MTLLQFQKDSTVSGVRSEENIEGKGDSDEISLGDDDGLFVQESFNHSGETIHRHFHAVLAAVLKMSADIIKPSANYNDDVPDYILNNPRYYPIFKDCIGAIDGTHVRASVRSKDQPKYIGRKGYATQNIMAVCDFNMCFTFVWAGWEGSAHDTRIFNEALRRPELNFPHPMGGKYYVVDAGYPNINGYLAPYKGQSIRYHIPEFRRGQSSAMRAPRGPKETFNYHHSSLRNIIERTFGVWKARWALLRDMHVNYTYEHQVSIVIASMAVHNFIRKTSSFDEAFNTAQQESYIPRGTSNALHEEVPSTNRTNDGCTYMQARRDCIALDIMESRT